MLKVKKIKEDSDELGSVDELEVEESTVLPVEQEIDLADLVKSNRRLARLSFYSMAFSLFVALCFSWIAGYYALALDTKISEQKSEFLRELDQRFLAYGVAADPKERIPKVLEIPATAPVLGDSSAPVTIVEYADFKCPYCGLYFEQVENRLMSEYVQQGKAKYVFANFAFLGKESKAGANAAKCAQEQGKFWEYHTKLFQSQLAKNRMEFTEKNLISLSAGLGLDAEAFSSCVKANKYAQDVEAETLAGRRSGVTGTPTIFINGQAIVGVQDYSAFKVAVDSALGQ